MIRVGCVGCGAWGKNLLRAWNETAGAELAAICRRDAGRVDQFAADYPQAKTCTDLSVLLADPEIHALSIATPPVTHYDIARQGLLAGKHVFVEKPMCLDLGEAQALAQLADDRGLVLMVGHLMEHHGPVRAIGEITARGDIGVIRHLHFQRLKLGRVRRDENVLWSFAPHDFSVASFLMGRAPVSVTATGRAYVQPTVEDIVFVDALYEDGASLHVHVSWLHPETVRKVVIVGDKGMIVWDDMAAEEKVKIALKLISPDLASVDPDFEVVPYEQTQPLQAECLSFIQCIENGTRPVNDGWDGVRVVEMLEKAESAMRAGR